MEVRQVLPVHHLVGVLLRVEHPDDQVGEGEQPVRLHPVRLLDRVEVRQVEQDKAAQGRLVVGVQGALPGEPPRRGYAQPVQQRTGPVGTPQAGVRHAGGGPAHPDLRQLQPRERVEQAGLPAAGRPGEGHHAVVPGQSQPLTDPVHHGTGGGQALVRHVVLDRAQEPLQRVHPVGHV